MRFTFARFGLALSGCMTLAIVAAGCLGTSDTSEREFALAEMKTSTVRINDTTLRVWLATTSDELAEGLMHVPEDDIADDQGMLFVFSDEALRGFWMKNTITSLDIAFARMNGEIVQIHTMPPLTLRTFSSIEPAMFALEVKAGTFERLNIRAGDVLHIPDDVFKTAP